MINNKISSNLIALAGAAGLLVGFAAPCHAAAAKIEQDNVNPATAIHLERSLHYQLEGNVDAALFELKRALAADPRCLQAHANLGALLLDEVGDVDDAISEDITALSIQPGCAFCQNQLNEAVAASKSSVDENLERANRLYRSGSLVRAAAAFRVACYVAPGSAEAHNSLSWTLYRLGKLDEALDEVNRALALQPEDAEYINTLACILYDKGQTEQAIQKFQEAIAKSSKVNPADLYGLAVGFLSSGKVQQAVEKFKQALQEDPNYADAAFLRDRIGLSVNTLALHEQLLTLSDTKANSTTQK